LFGSSSIREGMNLQFYASCLYNLYIDFNPTDNTQLEGRIWRQGNRFDNVRVVVPLMENSMDIFMFQKLEEKTERINQIWNKDGQTNELNTEDFNPSELKYELITDPLTLAELQVEDDIIKFDEQIDDINLEFSTLNNFKGEYVKIEDLSLEEQSARGWQNTYAGQMYKYLSAFRPDLVPLPFLKEKSLENRSVTSRSDKNYRYSGNWDDIGTDGANYYPKELIEKIVQFHREQKFSLPSDYKPDLSYSVGDEVIYETKRGKKKAIIESVNAGYGQKDTYDLKFGKDDYVDEVFEIRLSPIKEVKTELLFNPFTKDRTKLNEKWSFGQNSDNNDFYNMSQFLMPDDLKEMTKWADFVDYMKTNRKYNVNSYSSQVWWSVDYPLAFKRLEKAENDFLKPKGINNKKELEEKLIELTADIDDVIVQKKALSEQENLQEAANIIRDKREQELSLGIRNPSTYKQRAKEFSTTNSDYKGNEYLLILSEKELSKNIGSIELLRETPKYKELTKKAQKKLESKVKARLKSATKKVSKKDTSKGLSFIDKRIMALKLLIKIKGKNDFASKNIKALELAKKFKK